MSELWSLPARVTAKSEARDILPLHCLLRRGGCDCWMQDGDLLLCHRVRQLNFNDDRGEELENWGGDERRAIGVLPLGGVSKKKLVIS